MILFSFLSLLYLTNQFVFADEFWVNQKIHSRQYFSLNTTEGEIVVKKYSQEKGDYQERIGKKVFNNVEEAYVYLNKQGAIFKKVESLEHWPLTPIAEGSEEKGLFGKKNSAIWETKRQWSDEWEVKFGQWIEQAVRPDFYQKYNIETDCADAVVGLRWIFARINGLPAANSINDSGDLFGNFSMPRKWRKIPTASQWFEDELFMKALKYIMDVSYSRSIIDDGYPVRIDRIGLIPGDYIVTRFHGLGHVRVISETHFDELTEMPIYTLASTLPIQVRELVREAFVDPEWSKHIGKEILAFRWPIIKNGQWVLKGQEAHSRFSREQYDDKIKEKFPAFISFILSRVKETYDPIRLVEMGALEISKHIKQRMAIVESGYDICRKKICREEQADYKNWSTESRDEVIIKKFSALDRFVKEFEVVSPGLYENWIQKLKSTQVKIQGVDISLATLRYLFEAHYTSADPNVSPLERWGMDSEKSLNLKLDKISNLFSKRKKAMASLSKPCTDECYPKNAQWLEGNTYLIDAELNKTYVEIMSYCHFREIATCNDLLRSLGQKVFIYGNSQKSLADWVNTIPFLHSDPRMTLERRWGHLEGKIKAISLPYFETIKISKNALALIDDKKIFHLESGTIIFEAPEKTKLVLTEDDFIYLISESKGVINQLSIANGTLAMGDILDPDHILSESSDQVISYVEDKGIGVFHLKTSSGNRAFRIKMGSLELINKYSGVTSLNGSLLTTVQNATTMTFTDLSLNKMFEFTLPITNQFKNMNKMNLLSYSYPVVIMEYLDSDWGIHYPVKVNLETKSWDEIDLGLSGPFEVRWSSANLKKVFVTNKTGEDYPELYAVDLSQAAPVLTKLDNNFVDAYEVNGVIYFIQSLGTQWSQDLANRLMIWDNSISEFSSTQNLGNPKFMTAQGIYFSGEEFGTLLSFNQSKKIKMPKAILAAKDFFNVQLGDPILFSYRFDSSYGEFLNMGGTLNLNSPAEDEILPEFSFYSWINKSDLLHERWLIGLKKSSVSTGQLIGIGKNMGIWWSPLK